MSYACIFSRDAEHARLVELIARDYYTKTKVFSVYSENESAKASLLIFDADTVTPPVGLSSRVICFSRRKEAPHGYTLLPRPFAVDTLRALLGNGGEGGKQSSLYLHHDKNAVELDGETVALTPQEYALLSLLYKANGEAVSRPALQSAVFDGKTKDALNVYIHYLRKKLEKNGKKRIVALRGKGYALKLN